jgi:hypothetical protein
MDMPKPSWDLQEQVLVKRHYNPIIIIIIIIINSMSVYCRPDVTKNNAGKIQNTNSQNTIRQVFMKV